MKGRFFSIRLRPYLPISFICALITSVLLLPHTVLSALPTTPAPALFCSENEGLIGEYEGRLQRGKENIPNNVFLFMTTSNQQVRAIYTAYEDGQRRESFRAGIHVINDVGAMRWFVLGSYKDQHRRGWSVPEDFARIVSVRANLPHVLEVQLIQGGSPRRDVSYRIRLCGSGDDIIPTATVNPAYTATAISTVARTATFTAVPAPSNTTAPTNTRAATRTGTRSPTSLPPTETSVASTATSTRTPNPTRTPRPTRTPTVTSEAATTTLTPTSVPTGSGNHPVPLIIGVSEGQTVSGILPVEARFSGENLSLVKEVDFVLFGDNMIVKYNDTSAPFTLVGNGDLNTAISTNGNYELRVTTQYTDGTQNVQLIKFKISNSQPIPTTTADSTHPTAPASSTEPPLLPVPEAGINVRPVTVIQCDPSHRLNDDPIVFPGQPGMSHEHQFFGAKATNASSTYDSLSGGSTTCDNSGDSAAYWIPVLYDEQGHAHAPGIFKAYYYRNTTDPAALQAFPPNLRMIAGNSKATSPQTSGVIDWFCRNHADAGLERQLAQVNPPRCRADEDLSLSIRFPDCWDGIHLDSSDHKRHMAYSDLSLRCPATHPVHVPKIRFSAIYSGDRYSGGNFTLGGTPGVGMGMALPWYAMHADFWNTWKQNDLETLVNGLK